MKSQVIPRDKTVLKKKKKIEVSQFIISKLISVKKEKLFFCALMFTQLGFVN